MIGKDKNKKSENMRLSSITYMMDIFSGVLYLKLHLELHFDSHQFYIIWDLIKNVKHYTGSLQKMVITNK